MLYRTGFSALTADEFGRVITAAFWSKNPVMYWHGMWLPFHAYLHGMSLWVHWELLWMPRFITILFGLISIVVIYFLASSLFESRSVGMMSALLLSLNPAHIWLSGTPLTEMPHAMFVLIAIWTFGMYLKKSQSAYLFSAALALALANGFRFEAWLISMIFTFFLVSKIIWQAVNRRIQGDTLRNIFVAMVIPWIFPLAWVIGNYLETKIVFYFAEAIKAYKFQWYGHSDVFSIDQYIKTFLAIDPFLSFLGWIALWACWWFNKKSKAVLWYVTVTIIPLVFYIMMSGGQSEPPGNLIRYLALFVFLFYPAQAYLLVLVTRLARQKKKPFGTLLRMGLFLFFVLVAITQLLATFRFQNDPSAAGLDVGLTIRELRRQIPSISQRPVLIELSYWQYLAIHVGANDISQIVYDRVLDFNSRQAQSLLFADEKLFRTCLQTYNISYVIMADDQLRLALTEKLKLLPTIEVNGYAFYPIEPGFFEDMPTESSISCPLAYHLQK
jgi:4-amino-4-deoxy-L-arabinose transferase-like glycosyltransferase